MNFINVLLLCVFLLVSACANQISITPHDAFAKLVKENPQGTQYPLVIEVPSANNGISNQILVASLSSGADSNSSNAIRAALESGKSIAVISKSEAIACATLNRALQDMRPILKGSLGVTVFGNTETCGSIKSLAESKGLSFHVITYP